MKILSLHCLSKKIFPALSLFFFSACNFENMFEPTYNDGVKDYFKEYTENAAIEEHTLSPESYSDSSGHLCVPSSAGDLVLDYYMRNPQKYILQPSVTFSALEETIDRSGVEIIQSETDHIVLTVPQSLLVDSDEGKNISPTISLLEPKSGRTFRQYSVDLYCNSKPPRLYNPTVLNDNNSTFAIAFDMPSAAELALRHKDLTTISINGSKYEVQINANGNFTFPSSRFTTVWKDSYSTIGQKKFTHTSRSVYFDTEEAFSADDKEYTLILSDSAGLTQSNKASTVITKLVEPSIYDTEDNALDKSKQILLHPLPGSEQGKVKIKAPAEDHLGNAVSGSTVHYTIYKGTRNAASLHSSGTFREEKEFELDVGTWYFEAWAELTNYENSSPLKCDIRVANNTIYVSSSGSDSDDNADGSLAQPSATIAKAVADINSRDESADYTIYVTGAIDEAVSISDSIIASTIMISGTSTSGTDSLSALTMTATFPVTLKDIAISGNLELNSETISIEGSTKISSITLTQGSYITVSGNLTEENVAEITPALYAEGEKILAENDYTSESAAKFSVRDDDSSDKILWYVGSDGCLFTKAKLEPGIISIKVIENESDIEIETSLSRKVYTFTAPSGYSCTWTIDGIEPSGTSPYEGISVNGNVLTLDTENWASGVYDVYLTATNSGDSKVYSYYAQITISY